MSKEIVTTAHLQFVSKETRDKAIGLFKEITDYAYANEKEGTSRYVTLLPVEESNTTSLYMLEQYANQAASDAHLQAAPVQALIKYFTEEGPLAGAPEVHNLNPSIDIRRDITSAKPGMIFLFAHMGIKPGKVDEALPVFEELIKAVEKLEPEFWGCTASADKEKNLIRVVDMFESEKFYDEEHTKSKPILSFHEKIGPYASGDFGLVKLKVVQGYLGRGGKVSKL